MSVTFCSEAVPSHNKRLYIFVAYSELFAADTSKGTVNLLHYSYCYTSTASYHFILILLFIPKLVEPCHLFVVDILLNILIITPEAHFFL